MFQPFKLLLFLLFEKLPTVFFPAMNTGKIAHVDEAWFKANYKLFPSLNTQRPLVACLDQ